MDNNLSNYSNNISVYENINKEIYSYLHYLHADYRPQLCCCYHNFSTVVAFGFHQVYDDPGNIEEIPNWTLYSISGGGCPRFTAYA